MDFDGAGTMCYTLGVDPDRHSGGTLVRRVSVLRNSSLNRRVSIGLALHSTLPIIVRPYGLATGMRKQRQVGKARAARPATWQVRHA